MYLSNENVWASILEEINSISRNNENDSNSQKNKEDSNFAEEMKIFDIFNELKPEISSEDFLENKVKFLI